MKRKLFAIFILIMALALPGYFALRPLLKQKNTKVTTGNTSVNINVDSNINTNPSRSGENKGNTVFFPMTRPEERKTKRTYGKYVTAADAKNIPCGQAFVGYHTADDYEVFPNEIDKIVPVYAALPGKIVEERSVSGYGGLIVVSSTINNGAITTYYGHIDLSSVKYKTGATVKAGSVLANLGQACTAQTGGERKHLHFGIHKGSNIDVRGYVNTTSELANWLNPTELLTALKAKIIQ